MNLKRSLVSRIVLVGIACFALVMTIVLLEARQETRQRDERTAQLVAQHLELQAFKVDSNLDAAQRFPDWDALGSHVSESGQCVRFEDDQGRILRSTCIGATASANTIPGWFAALHALVLSSDEPARRAVAYRGKSYGTVLVWSDPKAVMDGTWRETKQMLRLTAITVICLCLLVYFAIERALAETKDVVAGLNRLADGDFACRLPRFRLSELQRIGEVSNQLAEKIEHTLAERSELLRRLMDAQEQERRHLGRELHDEFAQNLTAISALAAALEQSAAGDGDALRSEARALSQISAKMMKSLRGTLLHLRPADLDEFGLIESLRQLVAVWSAGGGQATRFEFDAPRDIGPLSEDTAIHVYRIAQEALTNAVKHADAKTVRVRLAPMSVPETGGRQGGAIALTIKDDGTGRREPSPEAAGSGRGIPNMRERVAALGGSIAFEEGPQGGLRVRVVVPVGDAPEGAP